MGTKLSKYLDEINRRPHCSEGECKLEIYDLGMCRRHHRRWHQTFVGPLLGEDTNEWGELQCTQCARWFPPFEYEEDYIIDEAICRKCKRRINANRHRGTIKVRAFVDLLLERQENGCAICRRHLVRDAGRAKCPHVDHDHSCCPPGKKCVKCIRGCLCQSCNMLLGFAGDNIDTLESAIVYLKSFKEHGVPMAMIEKVA